jgi:hypothetical protein
MEEQVMSTRESDSLEPIITKNNATFFFSNITEEELGDKLQKYLLKKGYKLEAGTTTNGTYGKGSQVMRVLFGAFAKRFSWLISIKSSEFGTNLVFSKNEKGYMGGVIGVSQVKNEYTRIVNALNHFYQSLEKKQDAE